MLERLIKLTFSFILSIVRVLLTWRYTAYEDHADTWEHLWAETTCMYLNMAHSDSFISHLSSSVSLSFLISAFSPLSDCINTFIWYSQNALVCCATFLCPPRESYTCRFLQREERIADSCPLLNSRSVLWATTPPPSCLSEHLFAMQIALFFWGSRSSKASPLSERQFGVRKKVFSPHFIIQPLKLFELMLTGKMLGPGGFMTTGSKGWVVQLEAFCGCGVGSV